ncbi:hypothetical protein [Nocardioides antri]|uniref:Uncharacterized protein n=1 Tax=Nocardioides antri TaxID=2607659 RepID=A0A5B1M0J7_9ACTN|nr:hypothetical protein [Nocardioides antri]KAA1426453.1 hypothetical protein F0U47_13700 [Nocardioides antri]
MDDADEELTRLAIAQALELDHQYLETVPAWDQARVDQLRRIGRSVAREFGWRVRTGTIDLDEERLKVWIVIVESTPEDQERIRERGEFLVEQIFKDL